MSPSLHSVKHSISRGHTEGSDSAWLPIPAEVKQDQPLHLGRDCADARFCCARRYRAAVMDPVQVRTRGRPRPSGTPRPQGSSRPWRRPRGTRAQSLSGALPRWPPPPLRRRPRRRAAPTRCRSGTRTAPARAGSQQHASLLRPPRACNPPRLWHVKHAAQMFVTIRQAPPAPS